MAVDGNEIHTVQCVRANASLSEGWPHLVPQLQGKLEVNKSGMEETLNIAHASQQKSNNDIFKVINVTLLLLNVFMHYVSLIMVTLYINPQ